MQVAREALKAAIDTVKPAIASTGSTPELKHVWWDGDFIYGYNDALGIKVPWKWDLQSGGVLASVLLGVLESTAAQEVDLAASDTTLTVKVGQSTAKLGMLAASANPYPLKAPPRNAKTTVQLTPEILAGLRATRILKASKPTRVEHHGVILFPDKDFLALYSTDSKTLVEARVKGKFSSELERVVLPHAYVQQVLGLKMPGFITLIPDTESGAGALVAAAEGIQVVSNLLDSTDVQDLPKITDDFVGATNEHTALPKDWYEALNRGSALAHSDEGYLNMAVNKAKELTLTGRLAYGVLEERLTVTGKVVPGKVTVALDALKTLSREAVAFSIVKQGLILIGKQQELLLVAAHEGENGKSRRHDD